MWLCPAFFILRFFGLDLPRRELDWTHENNLASGRQPVSHRLR
jgi:hypothetical protein